MIETTTFNAEAVEVAETNPGVLCVFCV